MPNTTDTTTEQAEALKPSEKPKRLPLPGEQVTLTDAERATLYTELYQYWTECAWPASDVRQREKDWKEYNCAIPVSARPYPIQTFDGKGHSSNVRLPIVRSLVDAWKAQVAESVFAERPFYACEPGMDPSDEERAGDVESYYEHAVEVLMKYPRVVDELDARIGMDGTGIMHLPMVREEKFTLKRPVADETGALSQEGAWSVEYHGVRPEVVQIDRFRLYPQDARSIEDAFAVFHETWITRDALSELRKAKKAVISDEQWKAMCEGDENEAVAEEGQSPATPGTVTHKHRFRVVYAWMPYKTKGMDRALPFVFAFLPTHTGVCFSATPANTGHVRPFVAFRALGTGKPFQGLPLPRVIDHCLELTNTRTNQMVNHTTLKHNLALSPFFTPGLDFDLNEPWLGRPVAVTDASQVRYIDVGADIDAIPHIRFFLELIERFTGINANALGVPMPNSKTATEVNSMNTQGSKIFREQIEMLNMSHVEVAQIIATQMYLNGPDEITFLKPIPQSEQQAMQAEQQQAMEAMMAEQQAQMPPMPPMMEEPGMMDGMPPDGMETPMEPGMPAMGDSGAMGGIPEEPPMPPPMPDLPPPPKFKAASLTADAFAPGLKFSVRGSGAHLNRSEEVQEAMMLRETLIEDPLVLADAAQLWELDNRLFTALRIPNPAAFIGEKPEPGVSVPQMMAAAMPPAPPEPEPTPPPVDNSPKISIGLAFSDIPADAQAGLLEFIGLPWEGAAAGETAPPDPLQMEQMKLDAKVAVAKAAPKGNAANGNGSAPDSSPVGDGPEMTPMDDMGGGF